MAAATKEKVYIKEENTTDKSSIDSKEDNKFNEVDARKKRRQNIKKVMSSLHLTQVPTIPNTYSNLKNTRNSNPHSR